MFTKTLAAVACGLALLAGCGSVREPSSAAQSSPGVPSYTGPPPADNPKITWDNPDPDGVLTDVANAGQLGGLPFVVTDPGFGRPPDLVQVSNPTDTPERLRILSMLFRFPSGTPEFPVDGRVRLYESIADISPTSLVNMAATTEITDLSYELFTPARGGSALLLTNKNNGVGRVVILRGGLKYDLTGPALPASTARSLADKL